MSGNGGGPGGPELADGADSTLLIDTPVTEAFGDHDISWKPWAGASAALVSAHYRGGGRRSRLNVASAVPGAMGFKLSIRPHDRQRIGRQRLTRGQHARDRDCDEERRRRR